MLDGIHCNTVILGRDLVIAFVFREHTQESYRIRILSKATTDPKYIEGELNQSSSRVDGTPQDGVMWIREVKNDMTCLNRIPWFHISY